MSRFDPREELPQVCGDITPCQPQREEGPDEPAASPEVAHRNDFDAASSISGRSRTNLPGASGLEEIRLDDGAPHRVRLRPVVAEPLPNEPDRPGVSLGDIGPCRALVVDGQVLRVHVAPQPSSARREVARGRQDRLRTRGALVDDVNARHLPMLDRAPNRGSLESLHWDPDVEDLSLAPRSETFRRRTGAAPSSGPAIYPQSAPRIAAASLGWSPPSARATFPIPARPGRSGVRSIGGGLDACSPSAPGAVCAKSADASPQQFGSAGLSAKADGAAARASTPAAASAFTALTRPPPLRRGYIASGARIQTGREGRRKAHEA